MTTSATLPPPVMLVMGTHVVTKAVKHGFTGRTMKLRLLRIRKAGFSIATALCPSVVQVMGY